MKPGLGLAGALLLVVAVAPASAAPGISCTPTTGPTAVGTAYTSTCTVSNGVSPYSWVISTGALPQGINLSQTGVVSGTPTQAGNYTYTVKVTDNTQQSAAQSFSGTVAPPPAVTPSPTNLTFNYIQGGNTPQSQNVSVTSNGGSAAFNVSASSSGWLAVTPAQGQTPANISVSVSPSGLAAGTYNGAVTITPAGGSPSTVNVTIKVIAPLTLSCVPLSGPTTLGTPYSSTCTANGGTAPFQWSISAGKLPDGLALTPGNGSATVSGTPTTTGTYTYTVKATDSTPTGAQAATQAFGGTVASAPTVQVSPGNLTFNYVQGSGTTPQQSVSVTGGNTTLSFTVATSTNSGGGWLGVTAASGQTPTNIGVLVTPAGLAPGNYTGKVSFTAPNAAATIVSVLLNVLPALTVSCSPQTGPQTVGVGYVATCFAGGGVTPYGWSVVNGKLPPGLNLAQNGSTATITGAPAANGSYAYAIQVTDSESPEKSVSQSYTGAVGAQAAITLSPSPVNFTWIRGAANPAPQALSVSGTQGIAFSAAATASSGNWLAVSPTSGTSPASLSVSVNPTGLTEGVYNGQITLTAPGATPSTVNVGVSLTVQPGPLTVTCTPSTGPTAIGASYNTLCTASGGAPPYLWSITPGPLPAGLTLSPNGATATIGGTPRTAGAYSYAVKIFDNSSPTQFASQTFNGTIEAAPSMTANPGSAAFTWRTGDPAPAAQPLVISTTGAALSFTASATTTNGGNWLSVTPASGQIPTTLSLSVNTGVLAAGSYSGQVTVSSPNATPSTLTVPVTLTVQGAMSLTCTPQTGPSTVGIAYSASCTVNGGAAPYAWSISSGALPSGVALNPSGSSATISGAPKSPGSYNYTVTVRDASTPALSAAQSFSGNVAGSAAGAILTVSPVALNFTYRRDDAAPPPPQSISVFTSLSATPFTVGAATSTGGAWLSVSPTSGRTSASVSASVSVGTLAAGTYNGQIVIDAPGATPAAVSVPVTLTILAVPPAQLTVSPPALTYITVQGGPASQPQLVVANSGGGTLNFTATVSGGSWLTANTTSGRAAPGAPSLVGITLNPQGLAPGTYRGQVVVRSTDGPQSSTIPVTLTVNALTQSIVLTQTGLQFTALSGGTAPPAQSFTVLNSGLGTMNWSVSPQTISGANWLSVTPPGGSAAAGASDSTATVTVEAKSLPAGVYYGLLKVAAPGAGNSPQLVSVVVNVLAAGDAPPPSLSSVGLLPVGLAGGAPATDTTTLFNLTGAPQDFTTAVSTQDGGAWLTVTPASGTVPANSSTKLTVSVDAAGLAAGVRYGLVRVAFGDGSVRTVRVVSVLGDSGSRPELRRPEPAAGCTSSTLALSLPSLEPGFTVTSAQAVPMQARIVDNCGKSITTGAVVSMSFSNRDTTTAMVPGTGVWNATWTPRNPGSNVDVLVTAFVVAGQGVIGGQALVTGTVRSAASAAAASPALIANSASYLAPGQISPGSWVSIFGERLADTTGIAGAVPFPSTLNGTQVALGDTPLPVLYVSAGQVNALIPYSLSASTNHPLLVVRNGTSSVPLDVTVADVLPAIYTANQSGAGQGAILVANTGVLAAPDGAYPGSRPVQRGGYLEIYASGLGPVAITPADGDAAPAAPPFATTLLTPTITIGGVPATNVIYAGLAPGLVGLYQLNVQVPDTVSPGDTVPVVVSVNGNASNSVTIAVR